MTTLLQINTSLFSAGGQSTQPANTFVENWRSSHPDAQVPMREMFGCMCVCPCVREALLARRRSS